MRHKRITHAAFPVGWDLYTDTSPEQRYELVLPEPLLLFIIVGGSLALNMEPLTLSTPYVVLHSIAAQPIIERSTGWITSSLTEGSISNAQ